MKKIKMSTSESVTFQEGCEKYLDNCRQRNLRQGTINHYKQSYTQFYKYFDADMPVEDFTKEKYGQYVVYLKSTLQNDVSINSYLRDLITTLHFLMDEGYVDEMTSKESGVNITKVSFFEIKAWFFEQYPELKENAA